MADEERDAVSAQDDPGQLRYFVRAVDGTPGTNHGPWREVSEDDWRKLQPNDGRELLGGFDHAGIHGVAVHRDADPAAMGVDL